MPTYNWEAWRSLIDSLARQPFTWGDTDCLAIALKLSDALYTSNLWATYGGNWTDRASAEAYLAGLGGFEQALADRGAVEIARPYLTRGDWLYFLNFPEDSLPMVHVHQGETCVSSSEERGEVWYCPTDVLLRMQPKIVRVE